MASVSGIYGTDVSLPKAIAFSTPFFGFVATTVLLKHYWCSCYPSPIAAKAPAAERAVNHPLIRQAARAGLDPSRYSASFGSSMGEALPDLKKTLVKEKVHLICGIVSSLLTLVLVIVLIATSILGGFSGQFLLSFPLAGLLAYGYAYRINQKNIASFSEITSKK
jgi:hypothetical protein